MKKFKFLLGTIIATAFFLSCSGNDKSYEAHGIQFYPLTQNGLIVYADQTIDTTLQVIALDSWEVSKKPEWLTTTPTSVGTKPGYTSVTKFQLDIEPNTTNLNRGDYVTLKTSENQTIGVYIQQLGNIDIEYPKGVLNSKETSYSFSKIKPATAVLDTLIFKLNADTASIISTESWIEPQTNLVGKGSHTIYLNMEANDTKEERQSIIKIQTGNNVNQEITITQKGK